MVRFEGRLETISLGFTVGTVVCSVPEVMVPFIPSAIEGSTVLVGGVSVCCVGVGDVSGEVDGTSVPSDVVCDVSGEDVSVGVSKAGLTEVSTAGTIEDSLVVRAGKTVGCVTSGISIDDTFSGICGIGGTTNALVRGSIDVELISEAVGGATLEGTVGLVIFPMSILIVNGGIRSLEEEFDDSVELATLGGNEVPVTVGGGVGKMKVVFNDALRDGNETDGEVGSVGRVTRPVSD